MRLLVVEDEVKLAALLQRADERRGAHRFQKNDARPNRQGQEQVRELRKGMKERQNSKHDVVFRAAKDLLRGGAFGIEVTVRPHGDGYRAQLTFAGPDEALALARRLRPRRAA